MLIDATRAASFGTAISPVIPAVEVGDRLVLAVGSSFEDFSMNAPAGWNLLNDLVWSDADGGATDDAQMFRQILYDRQADAADAAGTSTYTWTWSNADQWRSAHLLVWRGHGALREAAAAGTVVDGSGAVALPQLNGIVGDVLLAYGFGGQLGEKTVAGESPPVDNLVANGTFDAELAPWHAQVNCSVERVTSPVHAGAGALAVASSAAGTTWAANGTHLTGLTGGEVLDVSLWSQADTSARTVNLMLDFFEGPNFATWFGSITRSVTNVVGSWTQLTNTITVPTGATLAVLYVGASATGAAGERHYFDDVVVARPPEPSGPAALTRILGDGSQRHYTSWFENLTADGLTDAHLINIDGSDSGHRVGVMAALLPSPSAAVIFADVGPPVGRRHAVGGPERRLADVGPPVRNRVAVQEGN